MEKTRLRPGLLIKVQHATLLQTGVQGQLLLFHPDADFQFRQGCKSGLYGKQREESIEELSDVKNEMEEIKKEMKEIKQLLRNALKK